MEHNTPGDMIVALAIIAAAVVVYLLPSIIATLRRHLNRWPLTIVNLALGWTLLGWLACLVWSLWRSPATTERRPPSTPAPFHRPKRRPF